MIPGRANVFDAPNFINSEGTENACAGTLVINRSVEARAQTMAVDPLRSMRRLCTEMMGIDGLGLCDGCRNRTG